MATEMKKISSLSIRLLLAVLVLGIIFLVFSSGIILLQFVGIEYTQKRSLLIFLILVALLSYFIDGIIEYLLIKLSRFLLGYKLKNKSKKMFIFLQRTISNVLIIVLADGLMDSVRMSLLSTFLFSVLLSAIEGFLDETEQDYE